MAKKSNAFELAAGLSFGDNAEKKTTTPEPKRQDPVVESNVPVEEPASKPVRESVQQAEDTGYQYQETEQRTVRIQAVVTETTARKLDALTKEKKIKSKNDLINYLLEEYFKDVELR